MLDTFASTVSGIPCRIQIDHYLRVPRWTGNPLSCPSADDFYGYTECEYTVLDRKGHPAEWLANKLTPADDERLRKEIDNHMQ